MSRSLSGGVLAVDRGRCDRSCVDVDVCRRPDRTGARAALRPAGARPHRRAGPLLQVAVYRYGRLYRQAHSRARQRAPGSAGVRQSAPGGRRLRALPYRRSAAVLSIRLQHPRRRRATRRHAELGASPQLVGGVDHRYRARQARRPDGRHPRPDDRRRQALRPRGRRRAHQARRSAGGELGGGVPSHADRTATARRLLPRARVAGEPADQGRSRPQGHGHPRAGSAAVRADPRRGRRRAQPHLRRGLWRRPGVFRLLPLDAGLSEQLRQRADARPYQSEVGLLPVLLDHADPGFGGLAAPAPAPSAQIASPSAKADGVRE